MKTNISTTGTKAPRGNIKRRIFFYSLFYCLALLVCLAVMVLIKRATLMPEVETVTVNPSGQNKNPSQTVAVRPQLPARDAELEVVGDHIAAAITHLHQRQKPAALHALGEAETALKRAQNDPVRAERSHKALESVYKDIKNNEGAIQHGKFEESARQLIAINKTIDDLSYEVQIEGEMH